MSDVWANAGWALAALAGLAICLRECTRPSPAAEPPAPRREPAAATLSDLMHDLDAPRSRAATTRRMRATIDQHATNEDVGLLCIAVEPDAVERHCVLTAADLRHAIDSLLDLHDEEIPTGRDATRAARRLLGIKVSS